MLTRNRNRRGSSIAVYNNEDTLPPEICRICLKKGKIPIFGEKKDLSKDVMEFGAIEMSYDVDQPQHLCAACHSMLQTAILFRKTAQKSNQILNSSQYSEMKEEPSMEWEEQDHEEERLYDTDEESITIKKEYLEFMDLSDSESEWKPEPVPEDERLANNIQLELHKPNYDDKNIQMQLLNVKNEDGEINDVDNELVMIIVSDKDKSVKCNTTIETEDQPEKDDSEKHAIIPSNQRKCDICHELVNKSSYRTHIREHRDKYKAKHNKKYGKVECEICGKKVNKSYYKYHMKMHGTAEEQADRFIDCTLCKKTFSANYFSDHMRRVHDKNVKGKTISKKGNKTELSESQDFLKCPVCDKKVNESIFKEHLAKHGGSTKRYICDKCGKVFKHPSSFKTHSLTHGSELKYQCQFCPYRGLHLGLLKIHVRTHTGDYNYKCTECPARFITKSNLSKHLQRHTGEYKFKCDLCNKEFYSKRDLTKHQTVHLDLKNNVCEICGKGFGHRDNLLSHQLKVHKRQKLTEKRGRMPNYLKEDLMKR